MNRSELTSNRDDVERWADEHDAVPVREGDRVRLLPETELGADPERIDWETFHREVGDDRVVVRHAEAEGGDRFEVLDRHTALDRLSTGEETDQADVEERLVAGETVTGTVTETTVVEETIIEETTLESEVVDQEVVDRRIVDVELLDRTCGSCEVVGPVPGDDDDSYDVDRFLAVDTDVDVGQTEPYPDSAYDVSVEIDEDWSVTIEEIERFTVETRVVDVQLSEADTVGAHDREVDVDIDAVHDQLFRGDVVDVGIEEGEVIDTESYDVSSEFTADDTITTHLTTRRTVDREVSERRQLRAESVAGELLAQDIESERVIEQGLVRSDEAVGREAAGSDTVADEADETPRRVPEDGDIGKPVVTPSGDQLGIVTAVEDRVAYVDPHPGITERIAATLGWGEIDEEDLPLERNRIERITRDEVRVAGDYDEADLEDIESPE